MRVAGVVLSVLVVGCRNNPAESNGGDDTAAAEPGWEAVGPVFAAHCTSCHSAGGIGPFTLDDLESAQEWAVASAAAMEARTMPPWSVTADGTCGDWADSEWVPDDQIATVMAWADAGAPDGDAAWTPDSPLAPRELDGNLLSISTPEFIPTPQGTSLALNDEYRCFLVDPELVEDTYLTGYDVAPGNDALVHHVLVMPVQPDLQAGARTNAEWMAQLDDASPDRLGWDCFGAAGDGVEISGIPVTWAPGQGAVNYPGDVGVKLRAGEQLVVQVHYNMVDTSLIGQADKTTIELEVQDSVEREGFFALPDPLLESLYGSTDTLPPGEEAYDYVWERPAWQMLYEYFDWDGADRSWELAGVMPHMHELGRRQWLEIERDGEEGECVSEVLEWDFEWQRMYFLNTPIVLDGSETIRVTCQFDTTSRTEETYPGWGTENEMCLTVLFGIVDGPG